MSSFNLPFDQINEFKIVEKIHEGAYTLVFKGIQTNLDRNVLVKLLKPSADKNVKQRFEREAKVYARLSHPNIVAVFALGEQQNYQYIILEFIDGMSLKDILDSGYTLSFKDVAQISSSVLEAIIYAHDQKIIHRDIKPANILIDSNGNVKLADFGLARGLDDSNLTNQDMMIGTPAYMSPEQITGNNIDRLSDLFAIGILLWEMINGKNPFGNDNYSVTLNSVLNDEPKWNQIENKDLQKVLKKCLAKNRQERFKSVSELKLELESVWEKEGIVADKSGLKEVISEKKSISSEKIKKENAFQLPKTRPYIIVTIVILAALVCLSLIWMVKEFQGQRIEKDEQPRQSVTVDSVFDPTDKSVIDTMIIRSEGKIIENLSPDTSTKVVPEFFKADTSIVQEKPAATVKDSIRLFVNIKPPASVFINGLLVDSLISKKEYFLPTDNYRFVFENPQYGRYEQNVSDEESGKIEISHDFYSQIGYLDLEVRPWANVYIDDRFYDVTPLSAPLKLNEGNKILELRHPAMVVYRQRITINAGDTLKIQVTLQKMAQ